MEKVMVARTVSPRSADGRASQRVLAAAAMFGLGLDDRSQRRFTIVPLTEIPLPRRGIVFITGPSGGGKSTILELIALQRSELSRPVVRMADLPEPPDEAVIDIVGGDLTQAGELLSLAGLADAFVMLRRPRELSDGQRSRLSLVRLMELADRASARAAHKQDDSGYALMDDGDGPRDHRGNAEPEEGEAGCAGPGAVILADEFGATLDRMTARTLARNIRRWISREGCNHTFICATTHDDLLESLRPEVLVWKGLGGGVEVVERDGLMR